MNQSNSAPDVVGQLAEQIADAVRGGRAPEDAARRLASIWPTEQVREALERYREAVRRVWTMKEPGSIYNKYVDPWYRGPDPDDRHWNSYAQRLASKGWDEEAIRDIDAASTRILSLLDPPYKAQIRSRGLVVGHVQSGKTANFTAVIAKAADVGYRFFIVLSGMNNALRNQTQGRLDEDLVASHPENWITVTEPQRDFRMTANVNAFLSEQQYSTKVLGVIKKNKGRLERVLSWLGSARPEVLRACPVMIIDDEADEASPNSHPNPGERTVINRLIVQLLLALPKAAYVGYTATPFANLFIDPAQEEDLYPRDFIVDLKRGEGYFGAEELFGRAPLDDTDEPLDGPDMIRTVPRDEVHDLQPPNRDARFGFVPAITPSLREALLYFWMASAARMHRGQRTKHCSMLIHTTQYAVVHATFKGVIEDFQSEVLRAVVADNPGIRAELRQIWEREQAAVPPSQMGFEPVGFGAVLENLIDVIRRSDPRVENGSSIERIDYHVDDSGLGRIYVVVGGNVLSRGLTLEGLMVSFFVRSASAYDTLLQMGRWFGYRQGYADLPRVWMTDELRGYFYDLATVEREIRLDIAQYRDGEMSPMDFSVRIRTHPALAITSRLKMQNAAPAQMSYSAREVQTIVFRCQDEDWLNTNLKAAQDLINRLVEEDRLEAEHIGGRPHRVFKDAASERILEFLGEYAIHPANGEMPVELLRGYIEDQNRRGKIQHWSVAVVTRERAIPQLGTISMGPLGELPLVNRAKFLRERPPECTDIKALMSETDVAIDVPRPTSELRGQTRERLRNLRDAQVVDRAMLLLYPIACNSFPLNRDSTERRPLQAVRHVLGIALVFPDSKENTPQSYMTVDMSSVNREEAALDDLEAEDV